MSKKVLIALLVMLISVSICIGQKGQTGQIYGKVTTGQDGTEIPGVAVILKSPQMILDQMTAVTNEKGVYRFFSLAPGKYELTFLLEGLEKVVRKGIVVNAGKTTSVDISMSMQELQETIIVEGKAPTIDRLTTSGTSNMTGEFLLNIPSQRDLSTYVNMAPGITANTAHGSAETENTYNLDGVNVSDPADGTQLVSYSMEIMEEIAVKTGSLSAEYGNVKGAVIDVITKSGGNKFSGSIYSHLDHESFQANNTKGTPLYNPDDTTKTGIKSVLESGFTLGGPIIKDKLWFFVNLNYRQRSEYVTGFPYDKKSGEADIPYEDKTLLPYFKLSFQPSQNDKFTFSYNYNNWSTGLYGASQWETLKTVRDNKEKVHVFNGQWTKTFGTNFLANLKIAYVTQSRLAFAKGNEASFTNIITGQTWGSHWRNTDGSKSRRYQLNADLKTFIDDFAGSHELILGSEVTLSRFNWMVWTNNDPISGCAMVNMMPNQAGDLVYSWGFTVKGFDKVTDTNYYAFFANDNWSILNNLVLNLGVRYEDAKIIIPIQGDPNEQPIDLGWTIVDRVVRENRTLSTWRTFSPRFGLVYDLFSNGSTLFKASWGRYAQPALTQFVNLSHPNGWIVSRTVLNPDGSVKADYPFMTPSASHVGYGDHKLKAAYLDVFTAAIEKELWENWSIGIRYIKKWDRNLLHKVDASRIDMDALLNKNKLIWIGYEEVTAVDPVTGQNIVFYNDTDPGRPPVEHLVNVPMGKRDYDGIELTLSKHFSNRWSMNLSYVWANSRGLFPTTGNGPMGVTDMFINPNAHIYAQGRFPAERRHQIKLSASVVVPWNINIGTYIRFLSGQRYTRTVSSDYLGLELAPIPRTIYAEPLGAHGLKGLFIADLRLEKKFKIPGGFSINVFADIFNLFNSNTETSVYSDSSNPDPEWEFQRILEIQSPRLMRMGIKIEF